MIDPQIQSVTIVLVGSFNPAIFSPAWLLRVGLVKEAAAETAEVTVVHNELTIFKVGPLELQVGQQRLAVSTPEIPLVQAPEFAANLLGGVLPQTPIRALGINFEEHFVAPSPTHRIALGRLLAPVEPWGAWGKAMETSPEDNPSGLVKLSMRETGPNDRNGWFGIDIAPSDEISKFQAVKLTSNDHYVIDETRYATSAEVAANILVTDFDASQKKSFGIFTHIRDLTDKIQV